VKKNFIDGKVNNGDDPQPISSARFPGIPEIIKTDKMCNYIGIDMTSSSSFPIDIYALLLLRLFRSYNLQFMST
jgi:hypothetical protein